jgi:hypothetical protein
MDIMLADKSIHKERGKRERGGERGRGRKGERERRERGGEGWMEGERELRK